MPVEKQVEVKNREGRKEVFVSFEATKNQSYENVVVPDDVYLGVIQEAKLIDITDDKGNARKTVVLNVAIESNGQKIVPLFASPVISKAKVGGTNSKLFDLLSLANLVEEAQKNHEALETFTGLVGFLDAKLKKRLVKVVTKTLHLGQDSAYSKVDRIMRFEEVK